MKLGYKQTEIGVIPEDWEVLRLKDVCQQIQDGTHFTPTYVNSGVPFYSVENVTKNDFQNTKFVSRSDHEAMSIRCRPARGDILMTRITAGKIGDTKLIDWECDASIYVSLVLLKLRERVLPEFFYAYTKSTFFVADVEKRALTNATPKKINLGDIGEIPVPVPNSREEQRAIAAALADVDAAVAGLERLIAKKRDLMQATMQQLLTGQTRLPGFSGEWEVKRLGEIVETDPQNLPAGTDPDYSFNYIALEHVDQGRLLGWSEQQFATAPSRARRVIQPADILVATVRPNLQAHLLFRSPSDPNPWICSTGFCVVRCRAGLAWPDFVFALMFSPIIGRQIDALITGSNYPAINSGDVRALLVPVPSHHEQVTIAAVLSDMDAELSALKAQLDKTRLTKQAMMQELLTGRTRLPFQ